MRGIFLCAVLAAGCGRTSSSTPTPSIQDARVTGPYNLVLTSMNGHGTTNIYTRFTQTATSFTGAGDTLACPSNDVSQCQGQDASGSSIIPSGMVSGADVRIVISFPTTAVVDTITWWIPSRGGYHHNDGHRDGNKSFRDLHR